ncbi:hypothetical protein EVAR_18254_1 [Eumeta japonica]|uniref:Uncharacterized protein n=1 Tax=Eumeta variegata TaxID=151549 RepID=A0A4C1UKJ8_EUMVA|nr:hypothetical protein EVAR_18254_1 [Eumeta japonica]
MSHRTRERPAECLASPTNYDRSAARSTRELCIACNVLASTKRIFVYKYYHKTKWSTSLRSRHIVDLALSESDQSLRSPGPARIPSPAIPDRSSAQPSPSSSTSSPQFKRPKTVNVPDFNQPKNQAQADSEWGVDGCGRMHVGHQEIADGAGYK